MKTRTLLAGGAVVRVVALRLGDSMKQIIRESGIASQKQAFAPADLDGIWIEIGATDDPGVNRRVWTC
jgi:siroheme synthase (precorrin-2 oxidase/ferrochelatase)